jgi:hypothetical protein
MAILRPTTYATSLYNNLSRQDGQSVADLLKLSDEHVTSLRSGIPPSEQKITVQSSQDSLSWARDIKKKIAIGPWDAMAIDHVKTFLWRDRGEVFYGVKRLPGNDVRMDQDDEMEGFVLPLDEAYKCQLNVLKYVDET